MKKQTRLILLTVAAAAVTSTVQAAYTSGDLLVGFTSAGASNDYIFDVGSLSGLSNGETWTLGTNLGGTFTSSQFANADWGVIGAKISNMTIYSTLGSLGVPPTEDAGSFATIRVNVASVGASSVANAAVTPFQSSTASWFSQTDQPDATPGNYFFNNLDNPNQNTANPVNLYANDNNGDPAAYLGDFTVSPDGNTLTYTVPEPAAVSLLGGFGLLALTFRRRLSRQS